MSNETISTLRNAAEWCRSTPGVGAIAHLLDKAADEIDALEAECERLRGVMMGIATRHFAGNLSNADKEKELDQYLSEGIRQLEAERDALRTQLEAIVAKMEMVTDVTSR